MGRPRCKKGCNVEKQHQLHEIEITYNYGIMKYIMVHITNTNVHNILQFHQPRCLFSWAQCQRQVGRQASEHVIYENEASSPCQG